MNNTCYTLMKLMLRAILLSASFAVIRDGAFAQERWWQREQPSSQHGQTLNPDYQSKKRDLEKLYDQRARLLEYLRRNPERFDSGTRDYTMSLDRQVQRLEHELSLIPMYVQVTTPELSSPPAAVNVQAHKYTPPDRSSGQDDGFIRAPPDLRAQDNYQPLQRDHAISWPENSTWEHPNELFKMSITIHHVDLAIHLFRASDNKWLTDQIDYSFSKGDIRLFIYENHNKEKIIAIWRINQPIDSNKLLPVIIIPQGDDAKHPVTLYFKRST